MVTQYTIAHGTLVTQIQYTKNCISILHFNIYFTPYILKLNILHLCIRPWSFCNIPDDGHKSGRNMYMLEVYYVFNII